MSRSPEGPWTAEDPYQLGLLRYPASTATGARIVWPEPEPEPIPRRRLVGRWLARKAAIPLAWVVAVASVAGWAAAAAAFSWTLASGHAVLWSAGAEHVGEFVLAVADLGIGLSAFARQPLQSEWAGRLERRAAQRATAVGQRSGARGLLRRSLRLPGLQDTIAALPRPARRVLIAGYWVSMTVLGWQLVAALLNGFGFGDDAAHAQRLGLSVVMAHLMIWCWLAGRTLSRHRDGPSWL